MPDHSVQIYLNLCRCPLLPSPQEGQGRRGSPPAFLLPWTTCWPSSPSSWWLCEVWRPGVRVEKKCFFLFLQNTKFVYNHENNFNLCIKANFFKLLRAFAPVLHNSCKKFGKNQYFCKDLCENIYFRKNLHKISYHNKLKNKSTFVKNSQQCC